MLSVFVPRAQGLVRVPVELSSSLPADAVWIDLLEPTLEEERAVETALRIDVPRLAVSAQLSWLPPRTCCAQPP